MRWILMGLMFLPVTLYSQEINREMDFSGQFFFLYDRIFEDGEVNNEFAIQRGYITFRKRISRRTQIRFTQDVSVDREGDGIGNIELRIKYALVKLGLNDWGPFTKPDLEVGVVHRPWIDFEQKINDYRSQESMFLDQNGIVSSADYGVTFSSLFGGEMDEEYQQEVQSSYPGRLGSMSIGIYNGGGYSALEENNNKLLEGRFTLRPLPDHLPGFQASVFGSFGKGNIAESPDFKILASALSYESKKWTTLLQGFTGTGDASGEFVTPSFNAIDLKGWSMFLELKPLEIPVAVTSRFDEMINRDTGKWSERQAVGGIAYIFPNRSKIILNVRRNWFRENGQSDSASRIGIITEVRF